MTDTELEEQGNWDYDHLVLHPGVAAIISDDRNKILLHRRRVGDGWAPPSGKMEVGETVISTLRREIQEETGLTVVIRRLVGIYSDPAFQIVSYASGDQIQFVTTLFACRIDAGLLDGNREGTRWAWFDLERLPSDLLPYAQIWISDYAKKDGAPVIR